MKQKLFTYIILITVISLFGACSDEVENLIERKGENVLDTVIVSSLPNARILEYTVENSPTTIYSAIDNSTRTITVYLPHYYALKVIDPAITLPEGASISPDDEELVPVFGEEPFIYTVSAPGEADIQYTLNPVVQQPEIILNELSTSEDTTIISFSSFQSLVITGEHFITNISITKLFAIDANENEWEIQPSTTAEQTGQSDLLHFLPPAQGKFPEGLYWLEMRAYTLKTRMKYPVYFKES